ncbi:MAG: glutamine amidotransferase [Azospira oryzae]|uniref:Type 1 glutamine amidotransferase n=1 Tax=Pelomicrobium methylotrophicum TaxID=2602750 RepID=A0A5C7EXR1_9PROT|nr:type 1 glutamine amidotransferase [Pelomicrobium methylotrophicum]PZP64615.1 MAG: glutamine amidotransferase [Azospira oryzae]PZP82590.1 MAG: glutamine amidotransferase [Azospira oryzae]TXF12032.1 type 1 glutamine amidotransferase [Pelomicrobium methylotrophicum]
MKPVAIFRHYPTEGPGYFATYLERHRIAWKLIRIDAGDPVPADPTEFSGLAFMGGPMSVNDDLPWIPPALDLIRAAVERDIPVLGHCLGGQLMAKALGGKVTRAPHKEIGWGEVTRAANATAEEWFWGLPQTFTSFHWHGETFSIPDGATHVLSSALCPHQGFVVGNSIGLQCHVEMTEALVRTWCETGRGEIEASRSSPGVQPPEVIQQDLEARVRELNRVADAVYGRWTRGLQG